MKIPSPKERPDLYDGYDPKPEQKKVSDEGKKYNDKLFAGLFDRKRSRRK